MPDDIFNQIGRIIAKKGYSGVSKDAAEWITFLSNTEKKAVQTAVFEPIQSQTLRQTPVIQPISEEIAVPRKSTPVPQSAPAETTAPTVPPPPVQTDAADIPELQKNVMQCRMCKLANTRKNIVFGEGNPQARLMFIGEAPGADEDESGRPFVGRAGQLLTKMINAMQFTREEVYIANVIKCRPPFNRNPEPDEVACCMPFLEEQIRLVNPECIVLLGAIATRFLLKHEGAMGKIRGTWQSYKNIPVMVTYHPSFLLRTESAKRDAWQDLQKVMAKFGKFHKK